MQNKNDLYSFGTKVVHLGGEPDPVTGSIMPPIHQTSTFVQKSPGVHQGYEYTRSHNPTRTRLETCLAGLENAKHCLVTASGMSATTLVMHALPAQSKILCGDDVYGGTSRLFKKVFNNIHQYEFVDTTNLALVENKLKTFGPALLWLETPTNPLLKISDIKKISDLARQYQCLVAVDNTFMSPCFQNPLNLGADLVVHSMTKYINGHSDVLGGALMYNSDELHQKLWFLQNSIGPSQSPFDSWLVLRGIKTLKVRMKQHAANALEIAQFLEKNSNVEKVIYPGLPTHAQHQLAKTQMSGFGGMITFFVKGDLAKAEKVVSKTKLFSLAESLGGVESLIEHPGIMTHASVAPEVRKQLGITDQLIRISVGIEDVEDLKRDLEQALS